MREQISITVLRLKLKLRLRRADTFIAKSGNVVWLTFSLASSASHPRLLQVQVAAHFLACNLLFIALSCNMRISGAGTNSDTSKGTLCGSACQSFGIWEFFWNDVSCPCSIIIHSYFPSQLSQCFRECLSMTSAMHLRATTDYRLLKIN